MPDKKKPIVPEDPATTNPDENETRNFFESLVDDHERLDEFLKEPESETPDVPPSADEGISNEPNSDDHEKTRDFFESLVGDADRLNEFLKGPQPTEPPSPAEVTPQLKSVFSRAFPQAQDSKVSEDKVSQNITPNVAQKPKRPPRKNDTRGLPSYSRLNDEQKAKEQEVFKQKQEEDKRAELNQQRVAPKKRTAKRVPTGQTEKRIAVEKKTGLTQDDYDILELRKKEKEQELLKKQEQQQKQQLSEMQTNQASNPGLFSKPQEKFDLVKEAVNLKHRMREQDAFNMVSKEIDPTASSDEPNQTTNVSQTTDRSPKTKKS